MHRTRAQGAPTSSGSPNAVGDHHGRRSNAAIVFEARADTTKSGVPGHLISLRNVNLNMRAQRALEIAGLRAAGDDACTNDSTRWHPLDAVGQCSPCERTDGTRRLVDQCLCVDQREPARRVERFAGFKLVRIDEIEAKSAHHHRRRCGFCGFCKQHPYGPTDMGPEAQCQTRHGHTMRCAGARSITSTPFGCRARRVSSGRGGSERSPMLDALVGKFDRDDAEVRFRASKARLECGLIRGSEAREVSDCRPSGGEVWRTIKTRLPTS